MRIIVQSYCAMLINHDREAVAPTDVLVSESGQTDLEAIGRLVTRHPEKFNLTKVSGKRGPIELD